MFLVVVREEVLRGFAAAGVSCASRGVEGSFFIADAVGEMCFMVLENRNRAAGDRSRSPAGLFLCIL